jgi:transposase InsO family protein
VEQISEKFLKPVLKEALSLFPFTIFGFHSDNGSEFINECVSRILKGMGIEQTKSRPRKTNDNALVESKNGAIIRKWLTYHFIPQTFAARLRVFEREHLIPYINFCRPCAFPTVEVLPDGKRKVKYKGEDYKTPCEKLCSLKNVERYLKPGITVEALRKRMIARTPNDVAWDMQAARKKLFDAVLQSTKMS